MFCLIVENNLAILNALLDCILGRQVRSRSTGGYVKYQACKTGYCHNQQDKSHRRVFQQSVHVQLHPLSGVKRDGSPEHNASRFEQRRSYSCPINAYILSSPQQGIQGPLNLKWPTRCANLAGLGSKWSTMCAVLSGSDACASTT